MRGMTSFELSREHEEFRRTVRDFAASAIAPHVAKWDKDHHFPTEVVQ
jgi:short-chain 2-methylacyl-CoA dehydrogenase